MPHRPTKACDADHCYSHDEDEPMRTGDYILCGECFHVFRTGEELVAAYLDNWPLKEIPKPDAATVNPDKITFCPHCLHDF